MNTSRLFLSVAALLLLAGCGTTIKPTTSTTSTTEPAVGTTGTAATIESTGQPTGQPPDWLQPIERPQHSDMTSNRAVVSLLEQARSEFDSGKREAADISLNRAQRIEPRNPWVWQEIAQLRLADGQYDQAISFAKKSISLANGKRLVQAVDWQVIAKARVAKGDTPGAEQAYKQAADLAQQAKDEPK